MPSSQPRDQTQVSSPALQVDSLPAEPPGKPKNTGVGILSLLQGIFPTQELNWGFPHWGRILYQLSYMGSHWKHGVLIAGLAGKSLLLQYFDLWTMYMFFKENLNLKIKIKKSFRLSPSGKILSGYTIQPGSESSLFSFLLLIYSFQGWVLFCSSLDFSHFQFN